MQALGPVPVGVGGLIFFHLLDVIRDGIQDLGRTLALFFNLFLIDDYNLAESSGVPMELGESCDMPSIMPLSHHSEMGNEMETGSSNQKSNRN